MDFSLIVAFLIVCIKLIECDLKSVHIVMRHGIRAPWGSPAIYLREADKIEWPNGISQLTDAGIAQSVNMGKYIRDRYDNFYPKNNSKNAILHSVNVDRCLDTISLVSRQLWPPIDREDWTQPRIFASPLPLDGILNDRPYCPKRDLEFENNLNKPEKLKFDESYQSFYDYVSNKTGSEATMAGTLGLFDLCHCLKTSGYPLPDWVTDEIYKEMAFVWYKLFYYRFTSEFAIKIKVGLLLEEIKNRMNGVLETSFETDRWYKNFFIYATHDYEVFGLNEALGVEQTNFPPFGAMIILELHEINNEHVIKVFYINETESLPINGTQMKLSFCPDYDCPYDTFITSITKYFPDWINDCGIPTDYRFFPVQYKYVTITDDSGDYTPESYGNSIYSINSLSLQLFSLIIINFIYYRG